MLNSNGPETYLIHYLVAKHNGHKLPLWGHESRLSTFECRTMSFRDFKKLSHVLLRDLLKLLLDYNNYWVCLFDALSSNDSSPSEVIFIRDWTKVTSLFCSSYSLCTKIWNQQSLKCEYLENVTINYKELPLRGMLSHLKTLYVYKRHKIKILLTRRLVRQL